MSKDYPGIDAHFRFDKPEKIRASMTITMPIEQWEHIASKLSTNEYQEWPLRAAIMDLVRQSKVILFPEAPQT